MQSRADVVARRIPLYFMRTRLILLKSLFQGHVLTFVELVLGSATVRSSLIEALVVRDVVGRTFVSVDERDVVGVQVLLRG